MNVHDRYLESAAATMLGPLVPAAADELAAHLAGCSSCRSRASRFRSDEDELRALLVAEPSRAVDVAIHAEIARAGRRSSAVFLIAAAALLVTILGAVSAGSYLLRPADVPPPAVLPSTAVVVDASEVPATSVASPVVDAVVPGAFPVSAPGGAVQMAAAPAGGLYVLIDAPHQFDDAPPSRATLVLLDASGEPRDGWPIALEGWSCSTPYVSSPAWAPAVAEDGSVRLVCRQDAAGGEPGPHVAFAFDETGRAMPGWPVALPVGEIWEQPRVVDDRLYVASAQIQTDEEGSGSVVGETYWLTAVARDGTLVEGARIEPPVPMGLDLIRLGPEGMAYLIRGTDANGDGAPGTFEVRAFDLEGERPGWPVRIDDQGVLGNPGFAPDGRIVFVVATPMPGVDATASPSRILAFDREGRAVPLADAEMPTAAADLGSMAGLAGIPMAPGVGSDGSVFVVGEPDLFRLEASGAVANGWPYRSAAALEVLGGCGEGETGCGGMRATPAVGPGNVLLLPHSAPDQEQGGSLLAIGPGGDVVPGWPVQLASVGAEFWAVTSDPNGAVYALVIEPASGGRSTATVLGIAPDGTNLYRTALVVP